MSDAVDVFLLFIDIQLGIMSIHHRHKCHIMQFNWLFFNSIYLSPLGIVYLEE